jgi:hypothetical protein
MFLVHIKGTKNYHQFERLADALAVTDDVGVITRDTPCMICGRLDVCDHCVAVETSD